MGYNRRCAANFKFFLFFFRVEGVMHHCLGFTLFRFPAIIRAGENK